MKYNICSMKGSYLGFCRDISPQDLPAEAFDKLLPVYLDYIRETQVQTATLEIYREYLRKFQSLGLACQLLMGSAEPVTDPGLTLWGIDVVCLDFAESLLEIPPFPLNRYGLCRSLEDVAAVLAAANTGGQLWQPCWVYACKN